MHREARATQWTLLCSGDDRGQKGEGWAGAASQDSWVSRKDASHCMGFTVKVAGVTVLAPQPWLWDLLIRHTSEGCSGEAPPLSSEPGWSWRVCTKHRDECFQPEVTAIYSIQIFSP